MTPEILFQIASLIATLGWGVLVFMPFWRGGVPIAGGLAPFLLSALYTALIGLALSGGLSGGESWSVGAGAQEPGFTTLAGVKALFSSDWSILIGWVHYLAFDLFIGAWEARDAKREGVPHLWLVPCLLLTFMFGPVGLLLYLILRTVRGKGFKPL